jgi:hypothetical protein
VRLRPESTLSIQAAMNGAWSLAANRSSSCAHAAIDTPSLLGMAGGGTERRASGSMPEAGGGASGAMEPPIEPTGARGGVEGDTDGGGTLPRWLVVEGVLDGGGVLARGAESGARVGGGTNARLAIVLGYYCQTSPASSNDRGMMKNEAEGGGVLA